METQVTPLVQLTKSPGIVRPERPIKVGLVQLNNSFSNQCYLPLSTGMLQAYAQRHLKYSNLYEFLLPIYTFMPIVEAAERLSDADIVGFSTYVWNFENSIAIAKELKRRKPETIIVFGGPHVPDEKKQFTRIKKSDPNSQDLRQKRIGMTRSFHTHYPFIDIGCHGEGERVFKLILEQMAIDNCRDKSNLPSASYMDSGGEFHFNPKIERMREAELAETGSPYLDGTFDTLMQACPHQAWIAMWETDRGCPYQCEYCDWGGATEDKVAPFPLERVQKEAVWFGEHKIPYVFCADANFGILKRAPEISKALAEARRKYGFPEGISVQNAKNPKPHTLEALEILERAGLNKATVMSIQSKNPETLEAVRRENMKVEDYQDMQKRLRAQGVYTMTDYIIPMPMETYDSVANGISAIISDGQHDRIQFNNLSILPNAGMGDPEYQEHYGMKLIRTKIINTHGKRNDSISGIEEYQELVVATNTMPDDDWVKTRVFCWMTGLLYFNKLLQIPIIILHQKYNISYRDLLELFTIEQFLKFGDFPILTEIYDFFDKTARDMQAGKQEEFIHSQKWLDIWWPPEEYVFIKLCVENKLQDFYEEAENLFSLFGNQNQNNFDYELLQDSIDLNKNLIKIPFQEEDKTVELSWNISEVYRAVMLGSSNSLGKVKAEYIIDRTSEQWTSWEDWYQKMVWYGNRRGAYLYGTRPAGTEIAGHH